MSDPGGLIVFLCFVALVLILPSIRIIGPAEVGLVMKRFGRKLPDDNPIAFKGEAGYQAGLLMPGFRFVLWVLYAVEHFPWVQVPAGQIGVVIAQAGRPLPIGAKSAHFKPEFGNFTNLASFIASGGQKGVQRPVLPPGTLVPLHPVAFLVITRDKVYGRPISPEFKKQTDLKRSILPQSFGLEPQALELVRVEPQPLGHGGEMVDVVGIVTTFEGDPLPPGDIASRLGEFDDVKAMLADPKFKDADIIEAALGTKNTLHNNYQDYQAFLDQGGKIGLQHDPLLYGAYALNPFLVRVEYAPMLVVRQGEVAVVKAYVGLPTQDVSGVEFKHGSIVRPGHRGIWMEPMRTGKYAINPRCYQAEIVPTAILTLNWADAVSNAHQLDRQLQQIVAKSREGFIFKIDLQVQIHVPDTKAPRVISMVGTMQNLVNEVLQAAVGNHFRDKLQSMPAVSFIETRQQVQEEARRHIEGHLSGYEVDTKGVYIQDVILPAELVMVLTQREIANQEIATFSMQQKAQQQRISMEMEKGTADMQADLARAKVGVEIKENNAQAREAEARGEATYIRETGTAKGAEVQAIGLARARAYSEQVKALGAGGTTLVNALTAVSDSKFRMVPDTLVMGGGGNGAIDGLAAVLTRWFSGVKPPLSPAGPAPEAAPESGSAPASGLAAGSGSASTSGPAATSGKPPTPGAIPPWMKAGGGTDAPKPE